MKSSPLVSVIITTYYRNKALCRAIKSVKQQIYGNIEIIVVDDSGEGYAEEVIDDPEIKYIPKDTNEGQISAWNTGISHSNGELIQLLDDDDRILKNKIKKQISKYNTSQCGVIYCGIKWESGVISKPPNKLCGDVLEQVLTLDTSPCVTSSMLIERRVLDLIYPIPEFSAATDDVLKIELAKETEFGYVDEVMVIRGVGDDTVSGSDKKIEAWWNIIDEYSELYDKHDYHVQKSAFSHIYYNKSKIYLDKSFYSIKARKYLGLALYFTPKIERKLLIQLFRSFGGKKFI